jgi:hypothetical protein
MLFDTLRLCMAPPGCSETDGGVPEARRLPHREAGAPHYLLNASARPPHTLRAGARISESSAGRGR